MNKCLFLTGLGEEQKKGEGDVSQTKGQSQIKCIGRSTKDLAMLSLYKKMDYFLRLKYSLKISYHKVKNFMRFKMI